VKKIEAFLSGKFLLKRKKSDQFPDDQILKRKFARSEKYVEQKTVI